MGGPEGLRKRVYDLYSAYVEGRFQHLLDSAVDEQNNFVVMRRCKSFHILRVAAARLRYSQHGKHFGLSMNI